jgi:hypothetical protein
MPTDFLAETVHRTQANQLMMKTKMKNLIKKARTTYPKNEILSMCTQRKGMQIGFAMMKRRSIPLIDLQIRLCFEKSLQNDQRVAENATR